MVYGRFSRQFACALAAFGALVTGFVSPGCGSEVHSELTDVGRTVETKQALSSCIIIQRGTLGAVEDTTITANVTTPGWMSTAPTIRIGGAYQALAKFDLSAIPSGVSVDSAVLSMYTTTVVSDLQINARAAIAPWTESTVSFASFGDQTANVSLGSIVGATENTVQRMTLKRQVVQDWLDGRSPNEGFLLAPKSTKGPNASKETVFVSSDSPTTSMRPALEVCFTYVDNCAPSPCLNGATCASKPHGYTCTCAAGFTGTNCETNIDDCAGLPCQNGGSCTDGLNGYTCACSPGYTGLNCEVDIDECAATPCQNGGTCADRVNAYSCTCPPGFAGTNCEINIDDCAGNPCQHAASCTDGVSGYTCTCAAGFTGTNCEINIDDCPSNVCQNGSTCVDVIAGYECACVPGFSGAHCEVNIDDCAGAPCQNGGVCNDGVTSYSCACATGYTGTNCEININDCQEDSCQNGGTCTDGVASYTCDCVAGYEGANCETNIDECASAPCANGGTCTDGVDAYACTCVAGFSGTNCETNIDECASNPCQNGSACTDGVNAYSCACVAGFSGTNCETNIDECASNPCENGGSCSDGVNTYTCACVAGFSGTNCETNINECAPNPCQNGGSCTDGVDAYTCACVAGFSGTNCETNIDECASNPCQNGGSCSDGVNAYSCACVAGFSGTNCETNIDECASNPCQNGGSCTDGVNAYSCACAAGFTGTNCATNINDCVTNPCQNGGTCVDGVNSFTCSCPTGYTGTTCQDTCAPEYATWSTTRKLTTTLSTDNRTATLDAAGGWVQSNVCKSSGKWYVEVTRISQNASYPRYWTLGVASSTATTFNNGVWANDVSNIHYYPGGPTTAAVVEKQTGYNPDAMTVFNNVAMGVVQQSEVIGVALDMDNRKITFKTPTTVANGTTAGAYDLPGTAANYCLHFGYGFGHSLRLNAGQQSFKYAVPSGHNVGLYKSPSESNGTCGTCSTKYANWSSVRKADVTLSSDERTATATVGTGWVQSDVCKSSGRWYFEATKTGSAGNTYWSVGVSSAAATAFNTGLYSNDVSSIFYYAGGPSWARIDKQTAYSPDAVQTLIGLDTIALNGVLGIALDMDNRQIKFHTPGQAGGTWAGPYALPGTASTYCVHYGYGTTNSIRLNAGQDSFTYPVPAGFAPGVYEVPNLVCGCPTGYTGTNCETNINECAPNPCQHGGTCTDGIGSYTCQCAAGYGGPDCSLTYATWSSTRQSAASLSTDKRTATVATADGWVHSSVCKSSGKWYAEVTKTANSATNPTYWLVGTASLAATAFSGGAYANDISSIFYYAGGPSWARIDKQTAYNPAAVSTQIGLDTVGLNGVVGIALDMDNRQIKFHTPGQAAGTWAGPYALPGSATSHCLHYGYGHGNSVKLNAGQDSFAYTVPAGHNPGLYD